MKLKEEVARFLTERNGAQSFPVIDWLMALIEVLNIKLDEQSERIKKLERKIERTIPRI